MSIVFAIILFSILIFVHELGHFLVAKLSGVQVNEFAIFMGPAIFKKQVGETLYSIRCIPIGGYCAMEGEEEDTQSPRSFQKASWWKRLAILLAGSAMNFVAGFLIMTIVFAPAKQFIVPVISQVEEECSFAGEAGIQVGDELLELDGEKIYVQSNFSMLMALKPADTHTLTVERNGERIVLKNLKMEQKIFNDEETPRYGFAFSVVDADFQSTAAYIWNTSVDTVRTVRLSLQMLLTGKAGLQDLTGPVGIVQLMNETAEASDTTKDAIYSMLYFGGFIAFNLAVMNLLPIPALDGGRAVGLLLTTGIEAITKKKIYPKVEPYVHGAAMVLLLALLAILMFKDIFMIFKG